MDDETKAELESLRMRLDIMERVFDRVFGDKPRKFTGPKKKAPTLAVKCPDCGAEPHEQCMTSSNKPTGLHLERVREQARVAYDARPPAGR